MARFLVATQPITGHVLPALPIVRALVGRGHEVEWYIGLKFRERVEAVGARFAPYARAHDYDDTDFNAAFPGRGRLKGLDQIRFDFIHVFARQMTPQYQDLSAILAERPADAVIGDPSLFAATAVSERGGPPNATYGMTCLGIKGRDVAPFGLGLLPDGSPIGQLRNRVLSLVASRVVFGAVSAEIARQCAAIGVTRRPFEGVPLSPYLFLQPTVAEFEYRRSDMPPQVHFIGPLLPDAPDDFAPPVWWEEVMTRRRPVVLVTQGTVATDVSELIAPTLRGLADQDVLVIAAGVPEAALASLAPLPANARVERFVPFKPLLPHVDAYVTNGGYGGVHYALANGVPIVAGGTTEDKPEIANRVAYSGVGINLKTNAPTPEQVRAAVMSVLTGPGYRQRARQVQAAMAAHDAPTEAALLLERLAATRRPVVEPLTPVGAGRQEVGA